MSKPEIKKHFVTFFSPGTFMAETTEKPITSWNVEEAVEMARGIKERYGAVPYAFQFQTRGRTAKDLDSRVLKTSGYYFLGGEVFTVADIEKRNDPNEKILLSNMINNHYKKIVVNTNSWKWTQPLNAGDVVLDVDLKVKK